MLDPDAAGGRAGFVAAFAIGGAGARARADVSMRIDDARRDPATGRRRSRCVPSGIATSRPTAAILPSRISTEPPSMRGPVGRQDRGVDDGNAGDVCSG